MGYKITRLSSIKKAALIETYIYVFGPRHGGEHTMSSCLGAQHFDEIGRRLGEKAAIITGYDAGINNELHSFFMRFMGIDEYKKLADLWRDNALLLITHHPLPHTGHLTFVPLGDYPELLTRSIEILDQ